MSDLCSPECGLHPQGCSWGGFGVGYWLVVEGCELEHRDLDDEPCDNCPRFHAGEASNPASNQERSHDG